MKEKHGTSKALHETTADTSDSMFVALLIRYKNYFVFLIFASLAMRENILTAKISRFTVYCSTQTGQHEPANVCCKTLIGLHGRMASQLGPCNKFVGCCGSTHPMTSSVYPFLFLHVFGTLETRAHVKQEKALEQG